MVAGANTVAFLTSNGVYATATVTASTVDVTSAAYTLISANNTVTITLTGGTFKAGTIAAADFTFAGTALCCFPALICVTVIFTSPNETDDLLKV